MSQARWLVPVLATCLAIGVAAGEQTAPAPTLTRTIVMEGARGTRPDAGIPGRIDHLAYDPATSRLFVAALENGSLEVLDLDKGERVRSIGGLTRPQGLAIASSVGCAVLACGGGTVHVYDTRTLEEKKVITLGQGADNVRYDSRADTVYVTYGNAEGGAIAVFDAHTWQKLREIPFKSRPESFQLDPTSARLFANLPGSVRATHDGVVAVVDRESGKIEAEIPLVGRARNFPMAFDSAGERLFVVSRRPPKLIMIDTRKNAVVAEADCTDDADDLFYDVKTGRVLVIAGGFRPDRQDPATTGPATTAPATAPPATAPGEGPELIGAIDVFDVNSKGQLTRVALTRTARHARTGLFVPQRRALYVAVPMQPDRDPEIREYKLAD